LFVRLFVFSLFFLLLLFLFLQAVEQEERVEEEGKGHRQHGVHDPVQLHRLVPVPLQPVENLNLVQ